MKWTPLKNLFSNWNDSLVNLMVSIASNVSLWYGPYYKYMLNYDNESKCQQITTI